MFWNSVLTAAYKVISKLEGGDQTPSKVSTILKILKKDKLFNKKNKIQEILNATNWHVKRLLQKERIHNILKFYNFSVLVPQATCKTEPNNHYKKLSVRVASRVAERVKT